MRAKSTLIAAGGTGVLGYVLGKVAPGDWAALLGKVIDGTFTFLKQQGEFASYSIVMAGCCATFVLWAIKLVVRTMQAEIDRIVADRDKLQQLIIQGWKSSVAPEKGGKRK